MVKKSIEDIEEELEHLQTEITQSKEDEKMQKRREKQEKFKRIFREDMDKQKNAHSRELERRRKLEESCKPSKVRTYACNE